MELELATLAAVTGAVGADRFDLMGSSLGAPVAVTWAAERPATVDRLILHGGWVRGHDRAQDRAAPLAQGRTLADGIAGARFEVLPAVHAVRHAGRRRRVPR